MTNIIIMIIRSGYEDDDHDGEINDNHDGDLDIITIIKAAISDLKIL